MIEGEFQGIPQGEALQAKEVIPLSDMQQIDGGNFILVPLPPHTQLETRHTKLRREDLPIEFPASEARRVNEGEKKFGERKGWNLLRQSKEPGKPGFDPRVNTHEFQLEIDAAGVSTLTFDVRPTTFAMASDTKIMENPAAAEQLSFTGSAAAVTTREKDGSQNIVIGYRLPKNANYPGMAGAAAGGVPKGIVYPPENRTPDQRGRLQPVGKDFFTKGIEAELAEEINITPENIVGGKPELVSLIIDKGESGNPHNEFGFELQYNGTTADLMQGIAQNDDSERNPFDFGEEAFVLTEAGLKPALTQSESPMPATHAGLYAGIVIRQINEQFADDPDRRDAEIRKFEVELQEHNRRINERVKKYYEDNPDKAEEARAKGYKTDRYDFKVPVVSQGLPDMRDWAREEGYLVDTSLEKDSSKEKEQPQPEMGWIFDADGVLFDTNSIEITQPDIMNFIIKKLTTGEPVAINTGRGVHFALDKLMPELHKRGITNDMLENFMALGEKGAVMAYFKDGDLHVDVDETISVPDYLRSHIFDIVSEHFSGTMFEGEIKESMLSPEKRGDVPLEDFKPEQQRLIAILHNVLIQYDLQDKFRIDKTKIATDIQSVRVGKHFGAAKILDRWREQGLLPKAARTFGDSDSDVQMAEELQTQGIPVEHIHVGDEDPFEDKKNPGRKVYDGRELTMPLHYPSENFSAGTAEYLKALEEE